MRRIKLLKLFLKNFKGVKDLSITFSDITNIKGGNGTGKTTVYDGFTWLLFDKDSFDRKNFEIKTLDGDNKVLHELDHEVTGVLDVDGEEITLTKVFKEKWTRVKGEVESKFDGHETLYYVNGISVKQSEYKERVSRFISEQQFKLLCNPRYFSDDMKWEDRRNLVIDIAGDISNESVISSSSELPVLEKLLLGSSIDAVRKSVGDRKRKLNDELKYTPKIIAELKKLLQEYDFEALEGELTQCQSDLNELEEDLFNRTRTKDRVLEKINRCYELTGKLGDIEYRTKIRVEEERRKLEGIILEYKDKIQELNRNIGEAAIEREKRTKELSDLQPLHDLLKSKWEEFFDREYIKHFDFDRASNLKEINEKAVDTKKKIDECQLKLQEIDIRIKSLKENLSAIEEKKAVAENDLNSLIPSVILETDKEYVELKRQVSELEIRLSQPKEQGEEIEALRLRKSELMERIQQCREKFYVKGYNDRVLKRIEELQLEEKALKHELAEEEKKEVLCDKFINRKVELLVPAIREKFENVKFKLLNTLVNGTVENCCEVLIEGVPFSNGNKAAQINTGLYIISKLSEHFGIQAPIFIDNRESINEIPNCDSQIINLIVTMDEKLKVE